MDQEALYDVAIIGGGLAGLSLAIQCANEHFKVVLFEKEDYPYHKVCGEYISLESWDFLQRLGVDLQHLQLPIIKTLNLSDAKGLTYSFKLPLGGFGISRYLLDFSLYTIAQAKGVDIRTNTKVRSVSFDQNIFTIDAGEQQVKAKVVAGSFGKRSNLDIKWKRTFAVEKPNSLNNFIGIKYHVRSAGENDSIALHNFSNGYCGYSKIEDGKSCLCYLTTAQNLRDAGNSIEEMQHKFLYKNPRLKEIFTSSEFLYDEPLAISQVSFAKKELVKNHILMLGDAAGMISPLCGNGMSMAMHSAKLSFESVVLFLKEKIGRDQLEKKYNSDWKKEFSKRLLIGRTVQLFFGGDTSTSLFIRAMHLVPPIARAVIRSTHGAPF